METLNNKKKSEKKSNFVDRRMFARFKLRIPLKFLEIDGEKQYQGQTLDISANGVGFISKAKLLPDTTLQIWLNTSDNSEPIYMKGRVVWTKKLEDKAQEWRCGVVLDKVNLVNLGRILDTKEEISKTEIENEQK